MNRRAMYALAGLETGITGALAMLVWLSLGSAWAGHSVWWFLNLVAAVLYGSRSLHEGAGSYTALGAAIVILAYGVIGIVYAQILGERSGGFRQFCFSLIIALIVYWSLLRWFWQLANPAAHPYVNNGQILLGHLLFGCFLAGYPGMLRGLMRGWGLGLRRG
jgi:ribose/xylose/arabinose/galactoside ABC-type transport system permease subunit